MTQPTQAQIEAAEMRAFGASEFACSKWPEDTLEHKALRAAFIEGAALTAAAEAGRTGQEASDNATSSLDFTAAAEAGEPQTSAEYHQRRGAAWDIIDQAIADYDSFMLDDDYDAQDALNRIIVKMRERRSFYLAAEPQRRGNEEKKAWAWIAHEAKLRTIERCAQVAEDILGPEKMPEGFDVPAAIRATKDNVR